MKDGEKDDIYHLDSDKPFTLRDVYRKLNKPRLEVLEWFQELGLIAREFSCTAPNCNSPMILESSECIDGYQWVCSNRSKKHSFKRSVRKGTWFEGSRLAMEEIILMIYFWIHEFMQSQVRQELNITNSESVVAYFNYCREVAVDVMVKNSGKIGGYGCVVEVIVSKFNRRKPVRGKKAEERWVYCGVELGRNSSKCFMEPVDIHYTTTFIEVIKKNVLPGSTIYCECLHVYKEFDLQGLQELCSDHKVTLTDNLNNVTDLNHPVESLWSLLKPTLPPYNRQREKSMFTGYLGEFLYRKMIKDSSDKFLRIINDIATLYEPAISD
ncbi:uncharacterized protein LOC128989748 [Macrosteles quadrilineatus]|uniref:uncharacterized protein LOC128989748 n=1 Tax=Macrosteles quadrilineatus TaxID=74068 RepID=UPI0023E156BB|nr:uncharacterized protein LOC128989748 [Macrosteles quadrilineatus]